jgi:UDP-galactopyranose mutase
MSQPIAMTGNPKEDVTNIRKMLETMLQYGFIHEEKFENIVLVGRLAEYKYYDMDDIVKRALEVFKEKVR